MTDSMLFKALIGTVGGLGLFLFGMNLMSDGLKKTAGQKLRRIVELLTKKPFVAFLVGAGVIELLCIKELGLEKKLERFFLL